MSLPIANDLDATWNFIQPGLEYILGSHEDQGVTSKMYMNCYTAVYNFCVNKSRRSNNDHHSTANESNLYSLAGAEIYSRLDKYLTEFIRNLKKDPKDTFLEFYVRKWTRFTIGAGYLHNVFDYMNRYWVQKERSDGRKDIHEVNTLALNKWKTEMFNDNAEVLISEILDLIEKQRNNQIVNTQLISIAIKSLVFLGLETQDSKKPSLVVYITNFEKAFLEKTSQYYSNESAKFLSENNVVEYMKKCESRLSEEISRSNNYLEDHTKKYLLETLNKVLIEDHSQEMYNQFLTLLEQNEIDHIQRMYKLLYKVPKTIDPLADTLENYIKQQALLSIEDMRISMEAAQDNSTTTASKPKRALSAVDPKTYINTLITIYLQFNEIVIKAFNKDPRFIKALDNACRYFVNNNPIALPTPKSACKTPELLAKYSDLFLRSNSKESDIIDMNGDNLMIIFKFINDKDSFEEFYRRQLAKRLINSNSKSEELEESIIQRLQEENSIEYTSKMTKMFSDMKASEDLKSKLNMNNLIVKDFNPLILAQSMWPFNHSKDYNLNVASELIEPFDNIVKAYDSQHNGRQLKWLWNHGRAEVKANLSKKGKPPFLFTVSNIQLMILIAFNKNNTYTLGNLYEIVGTSRHIFESHLLPLIKYKLIEQSPAGDLSNDDITLTIVEEYKSKKLKVNFISVIKNTEPKQEEEEATKEIDETRKNFLSACIVRIMKSRKVVKHNDLINEVLPQTLSRFRAKIIDVKRVIDQLIEKQYIQRVEGNSYEYLS
ncbi:ubiquitin ligase of SCF [Suhomyces tanzawaensis NRRL Y-17324]|uniref:Ubiquitin ligase of SCF n=1 Tax=Suhomyces tanzawaensis NRRL Y-17324 TaxID=984487 RepID=A0A1E4SPT7_9ASCO|nr:ubiquitin ligase of SCF [Suhomyces tanzawaensis NRRL Y-17324]ODV81533.1 ubiquitin ligase of SCF [Suhomyces tanzawaensis NRRL Y-17324]